MKFDFAKANLRKLLLLPLIGTMYLVGMLIPRDPSLWVFSRKGMFGDNPRYLLEYVRSIRPDLRCVWLAHTQAEYDAAKQSNVPVHMVGSLAGWWHTQRAGVGIVGMGLADLNTFGLGGLPIVQLWHGVPLKKIGFDSDIYTSMGGGVLGRLLRRPIYWTKLYSQNRTLRMVTAPSERIAQRYASAFGLPKTRIAVTGDPKTDIILAGNTLPNCVAWRDRLHAHYGIAKDEKIVLYAPTWRDEGDVSLFPDGEQLQALNQLLRNSGAWLLLRAHRADGQEFSGVERDMRVRPMLNKDFPDVNYLLPNVDILISDYSGIITDFSLLSRPLIFLTPDLEHYSRTRGLYEDYAEFTGGRWADNWPDAVKALRECLAGDQDPYRAAARHVAARHISFFDTHNCARIHDAICERFPAQKVLRSNSGS